MASVQAISQLYENVLRCEMFVKDISIPDIQRGIQRMGYVYAPTSQNFEDSSETQVTDFNDPAYRCAYLHKYAPLHTFIVQDVVMNILRSLPQYVHSLPQNLKICSLGGGPGNDVIGVLAGFYSYFGYFQPSVTIVDSMQKWEETFASIVHELTVRPIDNGWNFYNFHFNYIECNLLGSMTNEVNTSIARASFVTMMKFVSAAICSRTEDMVDKIFRVMKPGALALYIDNAAGGFTQIIERASKRNGLTPIFGPMKHVEYQSESLKIERFGYTSCFKTKVTIILLQKSLNSQQTYEPADLSAMNNNVYAQSKTANTTRTSRPSEVIDNSKRVQKPNAATGQRTINVLNPVNKGKELFNWRTSNPPLTDTKSFADDDDDDSDSFDSSVNDNSWQTEDSSVCDDSWRANDSSVRDNSWRTKPEPSSTVRTYQPEPSSTVRTYQPEPSPTVRTYQPEPSSTVRTYQPETSSTVRTYQPEPSSTVRAYQPVPGNWRQRDQPFEDANSSVHDNNWQTNNSLVYDNSWRAKFSSVPDNSWRTTPQLSSTVWTSQAVPGNWTGDNRRQDDESSEEDHNNSDETCCSSCVIS